MSSQGTTKPAAGEVRQGASVGAGAGSGGAGESLARGVRPDVALLQRAQQGDRGAYGQIVLLYQDRLYNAVMRLVGDREEARELTQEAFTRGLEKIESFRGDAGPYTWLFRIAVNLAISQLRKVQRTRVFSLDRPGPRLAGSGSNGRYSSSAEDQASAAGASSSGTAGDDNVIDAEYVDVDENK